MAKLAVARTVARKKPLPKRNWVVESLRVTAFPKELDQSLKGPEWNKLFGSEPERYETRPQEAYEIQSGKLGEVIGVLERRPERLDLKLSPYVDPGTRPPLFQGFGKFDEAFASHKSKFRKWLAACPKLKRLAFGAVLVIPCDSKQQGLNILQEFLEGSVIIDEKKTRDFQYMKNIPKKSKIIKGIEINKLCTWSVMTGEIMAVGPSGMTQSGETGFACHLVLDFNTDQEHIDGWAKNKNFALLDELYAHANDVTTKGDVL